MSNSSKMNQFLQRMLRKSDEEETLGRRSHFERLNVKKVSIRKSISRASYESPQRSAVSRKSSFSKPAWMRKLGSPFDQQTRPVEVQTPKTPIQSNPPIASDISTSENSSPKMKSMKKTKTLPISITESPNVQHIIQEFQTDFLSPRSGLEPRSGNFVKKIVAAFEEKYKSYSDSWSDKVRGKLKDSGLHRHSYSNICQSLHFTSVEISKSTETLNIDYSNTEVDKDQVGKSGSRLVQSPVQSKIDYQFSVQKEVDSNENSLLSGNNKPSLMQKDQAPIIIGAFLKKPVKVEEVSVHWIPFPGKKIPRKKSLKKLLSILKGKRICQKSKSENNVSEETPELPDSGYDEQSSSSASLTSISSNPEVLPRENPRASVTSTDVWPVQLSSFKRRSTNLSTFQTLDQREFNKGSDTFSTTKKLLLYEVPREDVKLDLGPCYPPPSRIMVKSLDRRVTQRGKFVLPPLPKHPFSLKLPKHPFISLSKDELDEPEEDDGFDQVEFRNGKDNLSCYSSECSYDVPRQFLSKSEPGIPDVLKFTFTASLEEPHYDVPKIRPKSSVYEDALSLKRRNDGFGNTSGSSYEYYSSFSENEPQFATIKSRNRRYLSPEMVMSTEEIRSNNSPMVTSL